MESTSLATCRSAVKKAMDAGLSREDAVRAFTLSVAEMYGMADRLGSIEKGKIANLVVTRGEIFDERTKVEMVFIDGKRFTPPPKLPPVVRRKAHPNQQEEDPNELSVLAPRGARTRDLPC